MLLQFVINAGAYFLAAIRDEGQWWLGFMKNVVSPALAAYLAFAAVEQFYESAPWKVLAGFFILALLSYTAWSIGFNSEHYLLANRTEEWRSILWGTLISMVSALLAEQFSVRQSFAHQAEQAPRPSESSLTLGLRGLPSAAAELKH